MQEIEDNFKSNGGKFEEFRIGDLFEVALSKGDNMPKKLPSGDIPLVSAGETNNGIVKYIAHGDGISQIFPKNTITADMFGNVFYQPDDYYAVSHGRVNILIPKNHFGLNAKNALFVISALFNLKNKYSFAHMLTSKKVANETLQLPTQNGEIAFDYMEAYIKELEADRVKELEAYLIATGLKDYTLTVAEQTALETFEKSIKINNLTQTGGVSHICLLWIFKHSKSEICLRLNQIHNLIKTVSIFPKMANIPILLALC